MAQIAASLLTHSKNSGYTPTDKQMSEIAGI